VPTGFIRLCGAEQKVMLLEYYTLKIKRRTGLRFVKNKTENVRET
jgi:hypothetical protein